jgi:glyoxylase-like metal-dependent hydrolase (beta-lactamase superfamily II)
MIHIQTLTFNPYAENTYLVADDQGLCAVIDPGCHTRAEERELLEVLDRKGWKPICLLNTHGHVDHMLGNRFIREEFRVPFYTHEGVRAELAAALAYAPMMGLSVAPSPEPDWLMTAGDVIQVGSLALEVLLTPGHSAGHISFFERASGSLFSGDVLFRGSIGRSDLPGGNYRQLMETIFNQLLPLGDAVRVYPGHGPSTTLGEERRSNPFLLEWEKQ